MAKSIGGVVQVTPEAIIIRLANAKNGDVTVIHKSLLIKTEIEIRDGDVIIYECLMVDAQKRVRLSRLTHAELMYMNEVVNAWRATLQAQNAS